MPMNESQLKQYLVDAGAISAREFDAAVEEARDAQRGIKDILTARYAMDEDDVRRAEARIMGVPFVSLMQEELPFDVLSLIPEPISREHHIVAYRRGGDVVEVAMLHASALEEIAFLKAEHGVRFSPRITDSASIRFALKRYHRYLGERVGMKMADVAQKVAGGEADERTVQELFDTLLKHAHAARATDIHLEPHDDSLAVRYRIGGAMHDGMQLPVEAADHIAKYVKAAAGMRTESHIPQGGRFEMIHDGEHMAVRVATAPMNEGERLMLRLAKNGARGFSLESLGIHTAGADQLHRSLRNGGLILVTGPEGSGVTTTMYTLLDMLSAQHHTIATIEDAVEYRVPQVNHTESRPQQGFSSAHGLRALLRQDADVIMVGNLQDSEVAQLAVNAALHGRLVIAGVDARTAADALLVLEALGVDRQAIGSAVSAVINQRLVRQLAGEVDQAELSRDERDVVEGIIDPGSVLRALKDEGAVAREATWRGVPFYKSAQGALGYKGKTALFEVMPVSRAIKDMLNNGAAANDLYAQARSEGMIALPEHGVMKAAQGYTTIEEILKALEA